MSAAAEKQRRYRQRLRTGAAVYRIEVPAEVVEQLIEAGRLDERAALNDGEVAAELALLLVQWARIWQKSVTP